MTRLLGLRDSMMAANLLAIVERGPAPDTIEGFLYALPQDRCLVDARGLAAILGDRAPALRVSPWFGYAPLDPAHLAGTDGIVFVKDASPS